MSLSVNSDNFATIFGQSADGFTKLKLREVHSSEPTNPVIVQLQLLVGYIEHPDTGTMDMIANIQEYGLHAPEFIPTKDFRTIVWRKESN